MSRRGREFTDLHKDFFYTLYDHTAELRHKLLRASEYRRVRRSV